MEKQVPVGIFDGEIYIANIDTKTDKIRNFDVLRPVSEDDLDSRRSDDNVRDYCKEQWQMAVSSGYYEESLDTFIEEQEEEYEVDDDDENFVGKMADALDYLSDEDRQEADEFMSEHEGIEIGTWEDSGCYAPSSSFGSKDFKKFDYVFKNEEAKKYAKIYVKSLKS